MCRQGSLLQQKSPLSNERKREDQDEDTIIYNKRRRRFDFQGRPYWASLRATLTPLLNNWAAAEKMTRGTNGALPVGYYMPRAGKEVHLDKDQKSTTVTKIRKSFSSKPITQRYSTITLLSFRASVSVLEQQHSARYRNQLGDHIRLGSSTNLAKTA